MRKEAGGGPFYVSMMAVRESGTRLEGVRFERTRSVSRRLEGCFVSGSICFASMKSCMGVLRIVAPGWSQC